MLMMLMMISYMDQKEKKVKFILSFYKLPEEARFPDTFKLLDILESGGNVER
jgi:hypothetical protein